MPVIFRTKIISLKNLGPKCSYIFLTGHFIRKLLQSFLNSYSIVNFNDPESK